MMAPDTPQNFDQPSELKVAPLSVFQNADATFWANNTIGTSFDNHSCHDMSCEDDCSATEQQNPEEVEETKKRVKSRTTIEADEKKKQMVTRGQKRLNKPSYREIAGLHKKE